MIACYLSLGAPADAEDLAAAERAAFARPWTREQLSSAAAEGRALVLRGVDGRPLAHGVFRLVAGELQIETLAVRAERRRRGLGRRLLVRLLDLAAARGAERAVLEVRAGNRPARGLYTGLGFAAVGRRRAFYADPPEDALVLARPLAQGRAAAPGSP